MGENVKIHVNVPLVYTDLRPYQMQETQRNFAKTGQDSDLDAPNAVLYACTICSHVQQSPHVQQGEGSGPCKGVT